MYRRLPREPRNQQWYQLMVKARNLAVVVEKKGAVGEEGPVVVLVKLCIPDDNSHLPTPDRLFICTTD